MLPIQEADGRVVAFIGRAHPDHAGDAPKYLNTPTTDLLRKHDLPYGLSEGSPDPPRPVTAVTGVGLTAERFRVSS